MPNPGDNPPVHLTPHGYNSLAEALVNNLHQEDNHNKKNAAELNQKHAASTRPRPRHPGGGLTDGTIQEPRHQQQKIQGTKRRHWRTLRKAAQEPPLTTNLVT